MPVFTVFFRISFSQKICSPKSRCGPLSASPTSATPSALAVFLKAAARCNFSAAVHVRNSFEFTWNTSSRSWLRARTVVGRVRCAAVSMGRQVVAFRRNLRLPSSRKISVHSCSKISVHYLDLSTQANVQKFSCTELTDFGRNVAWFDSFLASTGCPSGKSIDKCGVFVKWCWRGRTELADCCWLQGD